MPGFNGFDMLKTLATRRPSPPMIVITGHDEPGNFERAMTLGACAYLLKPVDAAPLLKAIQRGIRSSEEGNRHSVLNDGSIFKSRSIADKGAHFRPD